MSGAVLDFKVDHECSSLAMLFMQFSSFAYSASVTISKYTQPVGLGRKGSESRPEFQPQTGNAPSLAGPACRVHWLEVPACRVRCIPFDNPFHLRGRDKHAPPNLLLEGPACQVRCTPLDHPSHVSGHDERAPPIAPLTQRSIESPLTIG
jgi:hypothetical protein